MYLGKENFPNATDISADYIDKVADSQIPNLLEHVQMQYEKVLAPQTHQERLNEAHISSLIKILRFRVDGIPVECSVQRKLRMQYDKDIIALRRRKEIENIPPHRYSVMATALLHDFNVAYGKTLTK